MHFLQPDAEFSSRCSRVEVHVEVAVPRILFIVYCHFCHTQNRKLKRIKR